MVVGDELADVPMLVGCWVPLHLQCCSAAHTPPQVSLFSLSAAVLQSAVCRPAAVWLLRVGDCSAAAARC